jgi:hypothetical protein
MTVYDQQGKPLKKTPLGAKCGMKFAKARKYYTNLKDQADFKEMNMGTMRMVRTADLGNGSFPWCKLTDYFIIPGPGYYTLEIRLQVYKYVKLSIGHYIKLIKYPAIKLRLKM